MVARKETKPMPKAPENTPAGNTCANERPVEPGLAGRATAARPANPPTTWPPPPPLTGTPGRGTPGRGRRDSDQPPPPGPSNVVPTVPEPGTGHREDHDDVTYAPHLAAADAGREARVVPLGLAIKIARTTMMRKIIAGTRAMNNYRSNSPSPFLREELYWAKASLEESIEEVNKAFSTLMAADDTSMFAVYDGLLEAQLLLAEPHLLDLTDALFIIEASPDSGTPERGITRSHPPSFRGHMGRHRPSRRYSVRPRNGPACWSRLFTNSGNARGRRW